MLPEIVDRKVLWEGRFLKSILITFKTAQRELVPWEALKRVDCHGIVAIVPFTKEGEVILIKQYRAPVERYVIEFPAGLNDHHESLDEVAKRELIEETGYRAETVTSIIKGPLSAGASTEVLTVYIARDVVFTGSQQLEEHEEIEVIKVPAEGFYEGICALQDKNTYIDLKVFGLFELSKRAREY